MTVNVEKEVAALSQLTVGELRERYAELFQETTQARNRLWLVRRIAWRLQSRESGGLSDRARQRAEELANTSDLRVTAPRKPKGPPAIETQTVACHIAANSRLPLPGAEITRLYKGRRLVVKVQHDGLEFEGERFKSLSAIAKKVTGAHWNGFRFFQLDGEGAAQ